MLIRADKSFFFGVIMLVAGILIALAGFRYFLWIPGLLVMAIGWRVMKESDKAEQEMYEKEIAILKDDLRLHGEAVRIEFSKCQIKTNDYSEEHEIGYSGRVQFLNALQDERKNTETVEVYQSVIVFKYEHDGITEIFYSNIIPREREHLLFMLDTKKETMLYIDKEDRERYFFDLDFLDRHHH